MPNRRRTRAFLAPLVCLAWVAAARPVFAPENPPDPAKDIPVFCPTLSLPTDPDFAKKIDAMQDYVKDKAWPKATRVLQTLLDGDQDLFVVVQRAGPDGKTFHEWVPLRAEASRVLGTLPAEALVDYEFTWGQHARGLLAEAQAQRDPELLSAAATRYLHTRAGGEAAALLAALHLDRGRFQLAAVWFERLLRRPSADQLAPRTLCQAVVVFEAVGDPDNADRAWELLATKAPDGLRLGDRLVALPELRKELKKIPAPGVPTLWGDWPLFRGHATRNVSGAAGGEVGETLWRQATAFQDATRLWLENAQRQLEARSHPALTASSPILTGNRLLFRSHRGVQAVQRQTGQLLWESASDGSLDQAAIDADDFGHVDAWVNGYLTGGFPHVLFENSVIGCLSTDGARAYAVDDLELPPFPRSFAGLMGTAGQGLRLYTAPQLTDAVYHNRLLALDLETGKVAWSLGGRRREAGPGRAAGSSLLNSFFLGAPLPLAGKLFALVEKEQELRLLCLEPATGEIVWTQTLATTRNKMVLDGGRRLHAVHLSAADGVLVCPTNSGAVFGVDLFSHSLLWAYAYREEPPPNPDAQPVFRGRFPPRPTLTQVPPNLQWDWKMSAPVIQGGSLVFTAPDNSAIHCLRLRDGSRVWKASGGDNDVYLAGVQDDLVLIVGRQECRALSLADGKEQWRVDMGLPSGQGVFGDGVYYLPLKSGGPGKGPEICEIDLRKRAIGERLAMPGKEVPGNLLFSEGALFSQTPTALTAYLLGKRPDGK
jgi:outer membrane protein assembly factor BamB